MSTPCPLKPIWRARRAQVESVAAAGIENNVAGDAAMDLGDRLEQWHGDAQIVQPPPRRNGRNRIAWLIRSPILRLEQIDVSAARDIEGMPALAD